MEWIAKYTVFGSVVGTVPIQADTQEEVVQQGRNARRRITEILNQSQDPKLVLLQPDGVEMELTRHS